MFVEIHTIQNFAPSNLNRDDTGSPKDCDFGGHRRARVSSQCWKRAVREYFRDEELLPDHQRAIRTKKLVSTLADSLVRLDDSRNMEQAVEVAAAAVEALEIKLDAKAKAEKKTSVLLFLGRDQIQRIAGACHNDWSELSVYGSKLSDWRARQEKAKAAGKKKPDLPKKTDLPKPDAPKEVVARLKASLHEGSRAVDLALFGRMIAEDPGQNVDAACQVAHAISTHAVATEFDYYTAVDDLGREDESGAGMLGTQEFNSACFYRYANVGLSQLTHNLQEDRELALAGLSAFLKSFVLAIPKARQNGSAAQNLPSFVMMVVRQKGLASLANAFVKPVDGRGSGLSVNSVEALATYWSKLTKMYGKDGIISVGYAAIEDGSPTSAENLTPATRADNLRALIDKTMTALGGTH